MAHADVGSADEALRTDKDTADRHAKEDTDRQPTSETEVHPEPYDVEPVPPKTDESSTGRGMKSIRDAFKFKGGEVDSPSAAMQRDRGRTEQHEDGMALHPSQMSDIDYENPEESEAEGGEIEQHNSVVDAILARRMRAKAMADGGVVDLVHTNEREESADASPYDHRNSETPDEDFYGDLPEEKPEADDDMVAIIRRKMKGRSV
jgi:hypothetical protein